MAPHRFRRCSLWPAEQCCHTNACPHWPLASAPPPMLKIAVARTIAFEFEFYCLQGKCKGERVRLRLRPQVNSISPGAFSHSALALSGYFTIPLFRHYQLNAMEHVNLGDFLCFTTKRLSQRTASFSLSIFFQLFKPIFLARSSDVFISFVTSVIIKSYLPDCVIFIFSSCFWPSIKILPAFVVRRSAVSF
jgi:hypothetical protein